MDFTNFETPEDEKVEHPGFNTITKNLFPEIDELSDPLQREKIKVFIRIRPCLIDEISKKDSEACFFKTVGENTLVVNSDFNYTSKPSIGGKLPPSIPPLKYTFSKVFKENVSQKEFFDQTTLGMINDFVNGQNCLIFTYGVTNSGKTYTMMGEASDPGIMPRAMDVIFNSISGQLYNKTNIKPDKHSDVIRINDRYVSEDLKFKDLLLSSISSHDKFLTRGSCMLPNLGVSSMNSKDDKKYESETFEQELASAISSRKREEAHLKLNASSQVCYSVWVSMVEIYNDVPFDLLVPLPKKKPAIKRVPLKLKEDGHGLPYVKDLREICVTNADEAFKLLAIGKRNLQISSTSLNQVSSRSHCIFNVKLIKIDSQNDQMIAKISTLSLCDLAGSELNSKSGNIGERFKEANNINLSLMVLGRCIEALKQNQMNPDPKKHVIIPFRESKLTKLFQNFLIGKGQASMIVQINKLHNMIYENIKTIKFSALTNQVVLLPVHAVTVTMKNERENIGEPACKKKRMTIEWADEKEIAESKKESLMNFGALTSMEYDEKDEINDDDFSDIDNDNQNTSREDVTIEQQADLQKELQLRKEIENLKNEYKEMVNVYETRVQKLLDIQVESQNSLEEMYRNRLTKQANYYEDMIDRRINYCLEDSKKAQLAYEKTISDLQEELKIAKLSSSEDVNCLEQNEKNNQIRDIENKKLIEQIKELHLRNKKLENLIEENRNKFHDVKFKLLNQIQINELFLQNFEESENSQKILSANDEIIESFNDNNIDLIKYLSSVLENDNENLIEQTIDLSNKKIELDNSNPLIEHCLVPQLESELNKINELKEQNTALLNLIKDLSHKKNIKLDDTNFSMENDLKTKLEQTKYINQLVNWNKDFINKIKISDIKIQNLKLEIQDMNAILVDKNNHEAKFMKEMLELKTELNHQKNLLCENDNLIKRIKEFEKQVEELKLLNNATNIKLLAEYENEQKISDLNDKISSLINSEILLRNENLIYYKTINDLKIKIQEIEKFNEHNDKTQSDFENVFLDNQSIDFKTTSIKKRNLKKTPKTLSEVPKCLLNSHSQNNSEDLVPKSLMRLTRSSKHSRRLNNMDEVYTNSPNDNIENEVELDQTPRSNLTYKLRSKRSKIK